MENSEEYVDSWEYIEDNYESSIESLEEDYPSMYMNHSKEPEVFELIDNQDGMTNDPIPQTRTDRGTPVRKTIGIVFHAFPLNDIKIIAWPQQI